MPVCVNAGPTIITTGTAIGRCARVLNQIRGYLRIDLHDSRDQPGRLRRIIQVHLLAIQENDDRPPLEQPEAPEVAG